MNAITISALVEQMEAQWDQAKNKSDEAKAVIKKVSLFLHRRLT
jgi:hypothetical protein